MIYVLDPEGDEDGDGFTNEEEINGGTNPLDPDDKPSPPQVPSPPSNTNNG
jgi:hypothetical protein